MGTNAAIAVALIALWYLGGVGRAPGGFLPMTLIAASIGVWMFYVQHQFEETSWDHEPAWQLHDAALHGSSHYVLPGVLRWLTANIGVHHVHHLQSRVPFYRLPEILRDHPELAEAQRLTVRDSFSMHGTATVGRAKPAARLLRRGPRAPTFTLSAGGATLSSVDAGRVAMLAPADRRPVWPRSERRTFRPFAQPDHRAPRGRPIGQPSP